MNSCVSCLTWMIAIPVLFIATFALGPWMILLFGVALFVALWIARTPSGRQYGRYERCGWCGRPMGPSDGHGCC